MNDVMEQIKTLSATLDEETTRFHPTGRLLLLGSYESVFLKSVKRKADLLGIDCDLTQYPCPPYKAVVVDRETVPSDIKLTAEVDIDHSYSQGMSSVSQATLQLLPGWRFGLTLRTLIHCRPGFMPFRTWQSTSPSITQL